MTRKQWIRNHMTTVEAAPCRFPSIWFFMAWAVSLLRP
jgi:hypothetical protein